MPTRRTSLRSWRRSPRVRRVVTVVVVLNVALGLALSIIGLRHLGDRSVAAERQVTWDIVQVHETYAQLWLSISNGAVTPALAEVSAADLRRLDAGSTGFVDHVVGVRARVEAGELDAARAHATAAGTAAAELTGALRAQSEASVAESRRSATIADVETILLMLFAAIMGLVLVRRTVAVRVHAEKQRARDRQRSEARFSSIVEHSSDVITIIGADATISYQTPSVRGVLGYEGTALVGTSLLDLVHPDDRFQVVAAHEGLVDGEGAQTSTVRLRAADGTWRHVESVHTDMRGEDGVDGIVITSRDVTERLAMQQRLRHSALHDDLTGLANRTLFLDRVGPALARQGDDDAPVMVVMLDLDDFKGVNDALGHDVGDSLLVEVSRRLSSVVHEGDTVARLGGDEFAVLLDSTDPLERAQVAERIQAELRLPVVADGRELSVRASLGVAEARPGPDPAGLVANADLAMYAAKAVGKDALRTFDERMGADAERRLGLKSDLSLALRDGQVRAWFQPTVSLATEQVCGFEALARWEHPEEGLVSPAEFIPIAEQTGQIVDIGRIILRDACRALASWDATYPGAHRTTMAVNLSARELAEPQLVDHVLAVLEETGVAPERLTLEVTESLWVEDDGGAIEQLARLRASGIQVAIDDFGTGYSSLSYLERMPVDVVKIDKSFVDRVTIESPGVVVETIVALSQALGLRTVAEGIEQAEQALSLRVLGCDVGQGYLFSRPRPAADLASLLADHLGDDGPRVVTPITAASASLSLSPPDSSGAPRWSA